MEEAASLLEREHVHSVYEKVAPHFDDSRYKAWPRVRQFLQEQEPGSLVADVGCGNGRYLHINEGIFKLGCDVCRPLVDAARCRGHEVQVCDGLRLPYRQGCFDAVLSIAVIHHLSTRERRIRAIREMARTLRIGGRLMIYVWAMEQKRRKFEKQDIFIPWNPNLPCSAPGGGRGRQETSEDQHRKSRSASSGEDGPDSGSHSSWLFSRSLDSVLDLGSLAVSRPSSCGLKGSRTGRGAGLIRQVSSLFSSSRNSSEEDVFGREGADVVRGCGAVPLPDLVTHQREEVGTERRREEEPDLEVKETSSCLRYYHVFREGELLELIENHVEELHVLQSCFDHANWCVVAEKVHVWRI